MGGTRARITLRDAAGTMCWVNDPALAADLLAKWSPAGAVAGESIDQEVEQRGAVIVAGLQTAKLLTGSCSTPLAVAIRSLRALNAAVNEAKHGQHAGSELETLKQTETEDIGSDRS